MVQSNKAGSDQVERRVRDASLGEAELRLKKVRRIALEHSNALILLGLYLPR
jgi:hypothetical protein